jgi:aryl-alcohol dehydrogenase-like predicted oxidoreductase
MADPIRVGLGTIRLGRPWPPNRPGILDDTLAEELVDCAIDLGIRHFDTAPAYGQSEHRLGRCLARRDRSTRAGLTVATKFGESWNEQDGSRIDHSMAAARDSLMRSLDLLGSVDVLYIHKCRVDLLADRAWLRQIRDLCEVFDIPALGASVSDAQSAVAASRSPLIEYVQFPGNVAQPDMLELARGLIRETHVDLNRPLAMGSAVQGRGIAECLAPVKSTGARALSGASDVGHLREFVGAWQALDQQ